MTHRAGVVWDDSLTRYDFGPTHPMNPVRLDLTIRLARELGVLEQLDVIRPEVADDALLRLGHTQDYIDAVRRCGVVPGAEDLAHGLGSSDVPTFEDMHEPSAQIVGGTVEAARLVWSGELVHAFNPAGGLHHAMPSAAAGFCVYNDLSVAIRWLLEQGVERIAYVDIDVHHGDGVEAAFRDDPRVLTMSFHESPMTLYPGTGWPTDVGVGAGDGYAVNVAISAGTGDAPWLRALHSVVPQLLAEFRPQVLVSQHGCDSHAADPLAHLMISVDGQRMAHEAIHGWAHEFADGRWVATGGGGYAIVDVVPRCWTLLAAELSGQPLAPGTSVPQAWQTYVAGEIPGPTPSRMTDGQAPIVRPWAAGFDPEDSVDRTILATRRAVFPQHGLDPERG
jgi:acetoin utilization protein AcuC